MSCQQSDPGIQTNPDGEGGCLCCAGLASLAAGEQARVCWGYRIRLDLVLNRLIGPTCIYTAGAS